MERVFTVSEAARELGRSERWLRQAEARGSIPEARRDLNGWRVYTEADIATLRRMLVPCLCEGELAKKQPQTPQKKNEETET